MSTIKMVGWFLAGVLATLFVVVVALLALIVVAG